MVPIVEPEVIMDGTHSIEICFDVTKKTLTNLRILKKKCKFKGTLPKPTWWFQE